MTQNRRTFLGAAAANAAALGLMSNRLLAEVPDAVAASETGEEWDQSWMERVTGKYRAVFDNVDADGGSGVFRAAVWREQYAEVLKAKPADLSAVIVLRHGAIMLAMQQSFWDKYHVGTRNKVKNPMTDEPTEKNPVLLDEKDGVPPEYAGAGLHKQIAQGAIVLACNLAFERCVGTVAKADKVARDEARRVALTYLIPGVILQPSGVFAVTRAQEAGASYIKVS